MPDPISVQRVYDLPTPADGARILIDGIWPRGVRKAEWPGDSWRPEVAPSRELREWYRHDPERFAEFAQRYRAELDERAAVADLLTIDGPLTLVTATRDVEHSHATVLRDYLTENRSGQS